MDKRVLDKIFKYNTLLILLGICMMEKGIFRLGWVEESSIIPFFLGCLVFVMAKKKLSETDIDRLMRSIKSRRTSCILLTSLSFSFFTVLGSIRELYEGSHLRILFDTSVTFAGLFFLFTVFLVYAYGLLDSGYPYMERDGGEAHGAKAPSDTLSDRAGKKAKGKKAAGELCKETCTQPETTANPGKQGDREDVKKNSDPSESPKSGEKMPRQGSGKRNYVIYVIICLVCWTPLFLRFYPGSFGADSINQVRQAMHLMKYGNHLPVISTWLIEIFYSIGYSLTGEVNAALAFYTVFQMIITACTYAAAVAYLEYLGVKKTVRYLILAFFALTPMITMYAIYIHKDTPAADLLILLIIFVHYLMIGDRENGSGGVAKPGRKCLVLFILLGFLFMIFRSNHYFVYLGLVICALLAFKRWKRYIIPSMIIAVAAASLYKGPFLKSMDIGGADAVETLSMPLVMISYTLSVDGQISDDDRAFIENMISCERLAEVYSPTSANPVKRAIRDEGDKYYLEDNKARFLQLFARVFIKNPAACIIAMTDHSKGYYCPKFSHPELIMGTWENDFGAYTDSLLPEGIGTGVYEIAQYCYDLYEKYLGCAMAFWLTLFLMFYGIYRGKSFLTYMPSVGIVMTFLLASPNVGRFRYQYPVMAAAMLLVGLTLASCESTDREK